MKSLKKTALDTPFCFYITTFFSLYKTISSEKFLDGCLHRLNSIFQGLHNLLDQTSCANQSAASHIPGSSLEKRGIFTECPVSNNKLLTRKDKIKDQLPLIKATTRIDSSDSHDSDYTDVYSPHLLKGQSVLCVGGRAILYPQYRNCVKKFGGNFITYRGNLNESIDHLFRLLAEADMVICPVDCVNHEAFYTVKFYCKYSGKSCVLLDRSHIATFRKGIAILASSITK